jgi:hypothetical protein
MSEKKMLDMAFAEFHRKHNELHRAIDTLAGVIGVRHLFQLRDYSHDLDRLAQQIKAKCRARIEMKSKRLIR